LATKVIANPRRMRRVFCGSSQRLQNPELTSKRQQEVYSCSTRALQSQASVAAAVTVTIHERTRVEVTGIIALQGALREALYYRESCVSERG
jgi:hypothetical protein